MKRILTVALALAVVATASVPVLAAEAKAPNNDAAEAAKAVAAGSNAFAADLYARLAGRDANIFFSPFSIETALAMTCAGARGHTAEQMAKVLHLPAAQADLHQSFGAILKDLNAGKGTDGPPRAFQLSVANALWGQKGAAFLPDFTALIKDVYGGGLQELDFAKDSEGSRNTINAWVEKETGDKIKDLLGPGEVLPATRLVLTSAIYFKGVWRFQFDKALTKDGPFHLAGGRDVKTPLMNLRGDLAYAETSSFQAVRLPYQGNELAMIVILPKRAEWMQMVEMALPSLVMAGAIKAHGTRTCCLRSPSSG